MWGQAAAAPRGRKEGLRARLVRECQLGMAVKSPHRGCGFIHCVGSFIRECLPPASSSALRPSLPKSHSFSVSVCTSDKATVSEEWKALWWGCHVVWCSNIHTFCPSTECKSAASVSLSLSLRSWVVAHRAPMETGDEQAADRPLLAIARAWKGLQAELGDEEAVRLSSFSHGCSLISPLFGCLGLAFKFAEKDYVAKVHDLCGAAKEYDTLPVMVDQDVRNDTVRNGGSHTRNLLRVLRGVDMVRVLFEHILVTEGNSLKEPASKAYEQVFAPHHSWTIRKAVSAGMFMLPTKTQFLKKLHEEESSARAHIQEFVKSSTPVVEYVNNMFTNKELGTDW